MSAEEKNVVSRITEAFSRLPEGKREFVLGWAEGVIARSDVERDAAQTGT